MTFNSHMDLALKEAQAAADRGEVPVGAVVIGPDGKLSYKEIVSNLSEQPNYEAALSALSALSEQTES